MKTNPEIMPSCRAEWSRRVITDLFVVCMSSKPDCPH